MILSEAEVLEQLDAAKHVVLMEPKYVRRYLPLGLAKIARYLKDRGKTFEFTRNYTGQACDLLACTSLFTQDYGDVLTGLRRVRALDPKLPIVLGGICATLFPDAFAKHGFDVFPGYSKELDLCVPLYAHDWLEEERFARCSFTFTTRSCPNSCKYCVVRKIEPEQWINPNWREHIFAGNRDLIVIGDNNLLASPREHVRELFTRIAESGKGVIIDSGLDAKLVDEEIATLLARCKWNEYNGMRLAFDRMEEDGIVQDTLKRLIRAGCDRGAFLVYVLFNFNDTPRDANYRMREVINACGGMGGRAYPQQFIPLNSRDRVNVYVGKHWTPRLLKSFRLYWSQARMTFVTDYRTWALEQKPPSPVALEPEDVAALDA